MRQVWRKLNLVVDTDSQQIIAAELPLTGVTDAEVPSNLLKRTSRTLKEILGNGAYDTRKCRWTTRIPTREGVAFWNKGRPRNLAVGCQKLSGSDNQWKQKYGYNKCSLSERAMYRVKWLLGAWGDLRNDQSTRQADWERYARNSVCRPKYRRIS